MWLFTGVTEDLDNDTLMEMHGTEALYSVVKSLMHLICTEDNHAQQDAVHQMIYYAEPWTIS